MEICGGQIHAILRYGLDQLLPEKITLIHGPGCPVCVTPTKVIDKAIELAARSGVILCSFGDMLRVSGSEADLLQVKSTGGDVRIVYSPLDALTIAKVNPDHDVVFLAVGFETTAPANAMTAYQAKAEGIENFSMLVAHVLVPPAIEALLEAPDNRVDGFLAAGHVCTIMGVDENQPLAERHRVPILVTGFEPIDILTGVLHCIRQLEGGRAVVENVYGRAVHSDGNCHAQDLIRDVSRCGRDAGAGSATFREAASGLPPPIATSTPNTASGLPTVRRSTTQPASPVISCAASRSQRTARRSACSAPRKSRLASPWSRLRGPAAPTTATGARRRELSDGR